MPKLSFELEHSLMDRFINLYFNESKTSIQRWIKYGLNVSTNPELANERSYWFNSNWFNEITSKIGNYKLPASPEEKFEKAEYTEEQVDKEIKEAIYLMFSILGRNINRFDKKEKKFQNVPEIFNNIVRLAVNQGNQFTTSSKYKTAVTSPDVALQYLFYKLDLAYFTKVDSGSGKPKTVLCLKGEPKFQNNITFGDIEKYLKNRFDKLPEWDNLLYPVIRRLREKRNDESHNAFYTDPIHFWNNLVYILYDYILILFFLLRYFRTVQMAEKNEDIKKYVYEGEDNEAIKSALEKSKTFIAKCADMNVRFRFEKNPELQQRLHLEKSDKSYRSTITSAKAPETLIENNKEFCFYDVKLERQTKYLLQSITVVNGVETKSGKELELNSQLLFDGAVVTLQMPTEKLDYPQIEDIVAASSGLIEDSENRKFIEELISSCVYDETLRNKMRVLFMLDKGERESIVREFCAKEEGDGNTTASEDFGTFLSAKCDEVIHVIEKRFDEIRDSLDSNHAELKDLISSALSQIDMGGIVKSNEEIKSEIRDLKKIMEVWEKKQNLIEVQNKKKAGEQYKELIDSISQSGRSISEIYEIFKSQINKTDQLLAGISEINTSVRIINSNLEDFIRISEEKTKEQLEEEARKKAEEEARKKAEEEAQRKADEEAKRKADEEAKRKAKEKRRKLIKRCVYASVAFLVFLCVAFIILLSTSTSSFVSNSNWMSNLAHRYLGNKDIAYERARILEREKEYSDAAQWYMRARERYADLLKNNSSDSIRSLRMAQMLMRGKGGTFDMNGAEEYAVKAKRHDLAALLASMNGNPYKAKDIVNNYHGEESAYLELADAYSTMIYPHSSIDFDRIESCWATVDSLASFHNEAAEEALYIAMDVTNRGIVNKDERYIVSPDLYESIAFAQTADSVYNSLYAQLFLAAEFESMGLKEDAEKYNSKANENGRTGYGEITFSQENINDLGNDPQALVARAHNNAQKGYTDYRMTAYLFHLADSINQIKGDYRVGAPFYTDWLNFVVKAKDMDSPEKLLTIIRKDLPDSIRTAIADYVMAIKKANPEKEPADSSLADESGDLLLKSARKGLEDAQVAVAISLDQQRISDGMDKLRKMVYGPDGEINEYAARYILAKQAKSGKIDWELSKKLENNDLVLYLTLQQLGTALTDSDEKTLLALKQRINWFISQQTDLKPYSYLFGKLSEIEYLLCDKRDDKNTQAADFYLSLATNLSPKEAYASFFGISEIARKKGNKEIAKDMAARFASQFFLENGSVLDESAREAVVVHFTILYPDILKIATEVSHYDFSQDFPKNVDDSFWGNKDFKEFVSPVNNLHVELPDYDRFGFPVTFKYFD